ncbi:Intramolecular chaperone auto-processing domain containing protein [uncultured Caudovirales phage]|uniref:Intramolecular chaperone auto-processing domain containing protein n=1 Tax=uncultured Caudovirales phage TaxID=2100421 RepID=A0A6J5P2Z8_9CAUD|nr:Intramolecular chaperone auto-processing domain containing protein [uncultured Caudovirales phage]
MGKSTPSPPPAPDPVATANAQAASNAETAKLNAELNRVNTYTPYGNIVYSMVPGTSTGTGGTGGGTGGDTSGGRSGRGYVSEDGANYQYQPGQNTWRADVTLAPAQQQLLDLQNSARIQYGEAGNDAIGRVRDIMGNPIDYSGLPQINDGVTDRKRVEDALFARMQPKLDAQRDQLDTRLRNQGLTPGSEAWNKSWQEYSTSENDARLATIGAAGQEQQRLFQMSAQDRQRALQEYLSQRQIPLNEAAALMGGAQVQYPQFPNVPGAQAQPTDVAGIANNAYNANMANYNAQMQQQSGLFGGISSLGGALLSAQPWTWSDKRLKENIKQIGETNDDLPLYLFNYKGDPKPQIGVMAQDVEKRDPEAVREIDGFKAVDLERAVLASRSRKSMPRKGA